MGSGAWTSQAASSYASARGVDLDRIDSRTVNQFYTAKYLDESLNPRNIIRECCDSEEHPNTIPVILALDVTGSMGSAVAAVARKLNEIMTQALKDYSDIEFCIMGIGDLAYDDAPIQISQFESDVRILESLDKVYFERGGGGNMYESYTAAWYMGLYHTKLDCWDRGRKGIIITMGDEALNPYLPEGPLQRVTGDQNISERHTDTGELYKAASGKFDIYHIGITDPAASYDYHRESIEDTYPKVLGQHFMKGSSDQLPELIKNILDDSIQNATEYSPIKNEDTESLEFREEISW